MSVEEERAQNGQLVTFTDTARQRILDILDSQNLRGSAAVRVAIAGRGPTGFNYQMGLEEEGQPASGDLVLDMGEFQVFVDQESASRLQGSTVDFEDQLMGGGFRIHNPNPIWDDPLARSIQELIDSEVNPAVAAHGGVVQLIDVRDDRVYVQLGGGCQGCGMVDVTLRQGIEVLVKERFPQIQAVIDTTDHAGGNNPYYQPAKGEPQGASPYHQPSKGSPDDAPHQHGGGCGAPGCGAGGCGAPGCGHDHGPHHQPSKG